MNPYVIGGMAGFGLLKGVTTDKWKEDRQRWEAAQTQRYSPWTGLRAGTIQEADPLGSTYEGAMTGMGMSQNMANADAAGALKSQGSGFAGDAPGAMQPAGSSIAMEQQQQGMNPYARQESPYLKWLRSGGR